MARIPKIGLKGPPDTAIAKRKEERERKQSIDAADALIEADNKIADAALAKRKQKAEKQAEVVAARLDRLGKGDDIRPWNVKRDVELLTSTKFGRQALLKACESRGIDVNTYAKMLEKSAKVGMKTNHPDAVASRRHVTKSLENLHEVNQKEDSDKGPIIVNVIVSAPFRNVENPRNTGYTVVDGEGETPASGD